MKTGNQNITLQKADVKAHFSGHWADFYGQYLPNIQNGAGDEYKSVCPFHEDDDPSLFANTQTGLFQCFGCKTSGDPFDFYAKINGLSIKADFNQILKGIGGDFGLSGNGQPKRKKAEKAKSKISATYDYTDAKGGFLYQVVRMIPKDFRQRTKDSNGKWLWTVKGIEKVLYRLSEVLEAEQVILTEGEKDADNVRALGMVASTCVGGAEKWRDNYNDALKGRDIVILPDNDEPGRKHAEMVAMSISKVVKSIKIIELPGLLEKGDVSDWIGSGGTKEALQDLIYQADHWEPEEAEPELFPRGPFPWEVLPSSISESLQQLARSCATSPTSLPGASVAIFASVIGSVVSVCPKLSWFEPLIFWIADIRASGEGKTHPARALCTELYMAQRQADEDYKAAKVEYLAIPKKEREQMGVEEPQRARGYFMTNPTLEGIHAENSGHGGCVAVMDEWSAVITGQNQYKGGGNDREAYIALHDGKPARVVRASGSKTINGARISMFGGTQPQVWKMLFTSESGAILQVDGTMNRILPNYEGPAFFPLTTEAWSIENKNEWESMLRLAMDWANRKWEAEEPHNLMLSSDAQKIFIDWRNELFQMKPDLPEQVRGFIPKLVGYALRFAGVLFLMDVFSRGEMPGKILGVKGIKRGIKVVEFYLGNTIAAMKSLSSEDVELPLEKTGQIIHLAETLNQLRDKVDGGLLSIGFIQENYNKGCPEGLHVKSDRAMGGILRHCDLTIQAGKGDANGRRRVKCLKWDKKTEAFTESCLQSLQSLQTQKNQDVTDGDIEKPMSPKSPSNGDNGQGLETLETLKKQCLHRKPIEIIDNGDIGDNGDIVSNVEKKQALNWEF